MSNVVFQINRLVHYGIQVGLKVNASKNKFMRINTTSNTSPLLIDCEPIDDEKSFLLLGMHHIALKYWINKARQAFYMPNGLWKSNHISLNLKLKFFRSKVLSMLLYGSETRKAMLSIAHSLQVFINQCLKRKCTLCSSVAFRRYVFSRQRDIFQSKLLILKYLTFFIFQDF